MLKGIFDGREAPYIAHENILLECQSHLKLSILHEP